MHANGVPFLKYRRMHEKRCCKDKETKAEVSPVKPNSLVSTVQLNPADGISRVQNFLAVKRGSPFAVWGDSDTTPTLLCFNHLSIQHSHCLYFAK